MYRAVSLVQSNNYYPVGLLYWETSHGGERGSMQTRVSKDQKKKALLKCLVRTKTCDRGKCPSFGGEERSISWWYF